MANRFRSIEQSSDNVDGGNTADPPTEDLGSGNSAQNEDDAVRGSADGDAESITEGTHSTFEAAVRSLPMFDPSKTDGQETTASAHQMFSIKSEGQRVPAISVSKAFFEVMEESINAGMEAVYQSELAEVKLQKLSEFEKWANAERSRARNELETLRNTRTRRAKEKNLLVEHIAALEHRLGRAREESVGIDEETKLAERQAYIANLALQGSLVTLFEEHGFRASHKPRFENIEPDSAFCGEWAIPGQDLGAATEDRLIEERERGGTLNSGAGHFGRPNENRSDSRQRNQQHSNLSGGGIPTHISLSSQEDHGSRDGRPRSRSLGGHIARRKFDDAVAEYHRTRKAFDARHERRRPPSHGGSSEAGRSAFQAFMQLNREQIEAEDRFREARRECNDLGLGILYDNQASSFTEGASGEERAVEQLKFLEGPERQPRVQRWVDALPEPDLVRDIFADQIAWAPQEVDVDVDEWEYRPVGNDSMSLTAEGREKQRIEASQKIGEMSRLGAQEHWARTVGKRKQDWDLEHQGWLPRKRRRGFVGQSAE